MDPITSNFILAMVGAGVAGMIAVINALSKCCIRSRCTTIESPCFRCDRAVISDDNEVYLEAVEGNDVATKV
jgi:hypothetical protein